MADTVISAPQWSFVQLGDTPEYFTQYQCVTDPQLCLPIKDMNDLRFQMYASVLSAAPVVAFPRRDWIAYPVPSDTECNQATMEATIPDFTVRPLRAVVTEITDHDTDIAVGSFKEVTANIDFEDFPTTGGDTIEVGQCFKFMIYEIWTQSTDPTNIISTQFLGCSNCFTRVDEDCFYSILEYDNDENNYDFYYDKEGTDLNNPNRLRIPIYLKNSQLPSEENSYRKSNGVYIKLSERIEETVDLETDNIPMQWHRCLKVALSHDTLSVFNPNFIQTASPASTNGIIATTTNFVCREAYEIEPIDETFTILRKAKTKLIVSEALSLTNSNCQS